MPISQRFEFGFATTLAVAASFLVSCASLVFGLIAYGLLTSQRTSTDSADVLLFLIFATVFVLVYGFFVCIGVWISSACFAAVVTSRRYWLGPVSTGLLCAFGLFVMTLEISLDPFEVYEFAIILILSAFGAALSRVVGLTFGWARHWQPPGHCQSCGYDLRETPVGSPCSECGAVVDKPSLSRK